MRNIGVREKELKGNEANLKRHMKGYIFDMNTKVENIIYYEIHELISTLPPHPPGASITGRGSQ